MAKRARKVGSRELKTRLGTYLDQVKRGATIVVTDRGEPVAELRPIATAADATERALQRMEADGLITRPTRRRGLTPFKPLRLPKGVSASDVIRRERDEGW